MSDKASSAEDLVVSAGVAIPRRELTARATRSGGPGGQHVNTSSSRIELTWNVRLTNALDDFQRARVMERLANRIDAGGELRVVASDSRSQLQNRRRAEERMVRLVRAALVVPKVRRRTKPGKAAREARLADKKLRSERKRRRRTGGDDW